MFHPAISVATVLLSPGLWLLLSAAAAGLLFALAFGYIDATPKLQRAAFVICGLATLLFGGAFYYFFMYLWAKQILDLQLSLVLGVIGVLALAVPFLPDAWLGGDTAGQRRRLAFRSLVAFAGVGFELGLFVSLSPPYWFQSILEAAFWLCPAAAIGMPVATGSLGALLLTAFLNGVFFGAFGGVIGTVFGLVFGGKAPIAITIAVLLAGFILWRNLLPHPPIRKPTVCESFVAGVAMDFRYSKLCGKIPFEAAEGVEVGGAKEVAVASLRSKCFQAIALSTGNDSLCSEVTSIRGFGPYDGMDNCADLVLHSSGCWGERRLLMSDRQLAPIMRQLGYSNQTLEDAHISAQDNLAWQGYVDSLRPAPPLPWTNPSTDPQQQARLDFLGRIMNLQCKSE